MSKTVYSDHAAEAALPISQRAETVPTRTGEMGRVRRHHMSMDDQAKFRGQADEAGRFVAPYRRGGGYWGIVETLSLLGENEEHSFAAFWAKFMEVMTDPSLVGKDGKTPWESFTGRPLRSQVTGKNVIEKVHQNIRVLQRLGGANPYGLKLAQLNACIDVLGTQQEMRLCLRTGIPTGEEVIPIREIRRRSYEPTVKIRAGYSVTEGTGGAESMAVAVERAVGRASTTSTEKAVEAEAEG